MALIGSLVISLQARTTDLERGLNRARGQVQQFAAVFQSLNRTVLTATAGLVGFAMIRDIGTRLMSAGLAAERTSAAFTAIAGTAAKGREELAFVSNEANRLGLNLTTLEETYKGLAAASRGTTLEGQRTREIFSAIAEAGTAMRLSSEQMSGALLAVQQMMSKGTVQAEELRGQLGERLPGAFQIAARAMGVTTAELGTMLERGQVMSDVFLPRFAAQIRKEFGGSIEEASRGAAANFARVGNAIELLARNAASSGLLDWVGKLAGAWANVVVEADNARKAQQRVIDQRTQTAITEAGLQTVSPTASKELQRIQTDIARTQKDIATLERFLADAPTAIQGRFRQRQQLLEAQLTRLREAQRRLIAGEQELQRQRLTLTEEPTISMEQFLPVTPQILERVRTQMDAIRTNMETIRRQGTMGIPGFDVAAEQTKVYLEGLEKITKELTKHPDLVKNLPKDLQEAFQGLRLEVVKQSLTDITTKSQQMQKTITDWLDPLERNRKEFNFLKSELDKLFETFGTAAKEGGAFTLELTGAPEAQKQLEALVQRMTTLREGFDDLKDARKAERAEETAEKREARQAAEFLTGLQAEQTLRQESLKIRDRETAAGKRQIALLEFEAELKSRGITLSQEQRAEAEKAIRATIDAANALEAMQDRQEAIRAQGEAQRQLLTSIAREINERAQLLTLQKLGTTEREAAAQALTMEAELIANGVTVTAALRTGLQQLAQAWAETGAALEKAAFFRDLAADIDQLEQVLRLQRLSREEREREIAILDARRQLNRTLTTEEAETLRAQITTQQQRRAALEKATMFRDLGEDIADLRALVAAQRLSRREREIEIALIQEKRRLNRALAPEEEAMLRRQLTLQRDLNEELSRPRPLRDFAESTQDFFLGIEESAVRALEGLEEAFVRFASTGSFRSPEAEQTLQEITALQIERRALQRERDLLLSLPTDQPMGEALRQQERLNQLQREVDILDERKKILDDTAKSQNMLNKLFTEFYNQLLQASVRTLFTGPVAGLGQGVTVGQGQQGGGWTQLLMQGLNLVASLWGGGTATAGQAASAVEGFRQAGFTQGIVAHRGGLVGRDTFPKVALPSHTWATASRFATGGLVMSRGGDNVPALLQTGERVLSRQETARLAQLEQAVQLARTARQEQTTPPPGHTFNLIFPNVATRQDADALRRSASQVQNQIITAVERSRARSNIPSPAR